MFLIDVMYNHVCFFFFFFQAEDGIRDIGVTGVQTCALPISGDHRARAPAGRRRHRRTQRRDRRRHSRHADDAAVREPVARPVTRFLAYAGEAFTAIWRNRTRSLLTMLGMIIGTSSIIAVLGISRAASAGIAG